MLPLLRIPFSLYGLHTYNPLIITALKCHLAPGPKRQFSDAPKSSGSNRNALDFLREYRSRIYSNHHNDNGNNRSRSRKRKQVQATEDRLDPDESPNRIAHRDISSILGGVPMPDPSRKDSTSPSHSSSRKSWKGWLRILQLTWNNYRLTWEGFLSDKSPITPIPDSTGTQPENEKKPEFQEHVLAAAEQIQQNVNTNIKTLHQSSQDLVQYAKDTTQIHNKTDLKRWVMDQLQLATDMVREFMIGYREARQEEMERTITEYFKDLDEPQSKTNSTTPNSMMASDEDEMEDPLLENNNNRRYRRRKTVRRLYQWVDERKEIAKDNLDSS